MYSDIVLSLFFWIYSCSAMRQRLVEIPSEYRPRINFFWFYTMRMTTLGILVRTGTQGFLWWTGYFLPLQETARKLNVLFEKLLVPYRYGTWINRDVNPSLHLPFPMSLAHVAYASIAPLTIGCHMAAIVNMCCTQGPICGIGQSHSSIGRSVIHATTDRWQKFRSMALHHYHHHRRTADPMMNYNYLDKKSYRKCQYYSRSYHWCLPTRNQFSFPFHFLGSFWKILLPPLRGQSLRNYLGNMETFSVWMKS